VKGAKLAGDEFNHNKLTILVVYHHESEAPQQ